MKNMIERILADEKIRDIILETPYPESVKGKYPGCKEQGPMGKEQTQEHPSNSVDIKPDNANFQAKGPTGFQVKGLPIPAITRRAGQVDRKGKIAVKAGGDIEKGV